MRNEAIVPDSALETAAPRVVPLSPDAFKTPYRDPVWEGPTDPIHAAVALCGDGQYRLWYMDEARGSNTYSAVSNTPADPSSWILDGLTIPGRAHDGPKVFELEGSPRRQPGLHERLTQDATARATPQRGTAKGRTAELHASSC